MLATATISFISNYITSIGDSAFQSCGLTSITIPNSVISLSSGTSTTGVFYNCTSLVSITFPQTNNSFTTIPSYICYGCIQLATITFPTTNLLTIDTGAFQNCIILASVTIPPTVTTIGTLAFNSCNALKNIYSPNIIATIGPNAFLGIPTYPPTTTKTEAATLYTTPEDELTNKVYQYFKNNFHDTINYEDGILIYTDANSINYFSGNFIDENDTTTAYVGVSPDANGNATILSQITSGNNTYIVNRIDFYSFYNCNNLYSVIIPNTVVAINNYAFQSSGITSITILNTVTSIGLNAFNDCGSLKSITIDANSNLQFSASSFNGIPSSSAPVQQYQSTLYTTSSVVTNAFKSYFINNNQINYINGLLVTIEPSSNVYYCTSSFSSPYNAFVSVSQTPSTSVTLQTQVSDIYNHSYVVNAISDYAFSGINSEGTNIISITLPTNVNAIGTSAFENCNLLENIEFQS